MDDKLTFDPKEHRYFYDGFEVPSVSKILSVSGLTGDTSFYTEESRMRGINAHLACQYLDEGDLDMSSLDPSYGCYVVAYERFLNDTKPKWDYIEQKLYHKVLQYAGTTDRIGTLAGQRVLLDIKTGVPANWHGAQLSAYTEAYGERLPRYGLYLKDDGTYRLKHYNDRGDISAFIAALTIFNMKGGLNAK